MKKVKTTVEIVYTKNVVVSPIRCIETGEEFVSVKEAIMWLQTMSDAKFNTVRGVLNKHLNKSEHMTTKGYVQRRKSVYGYTFEYIERG